MMHSLSSASDKHIKDVLEWRESLTLMPDNLFFELMRMYIGEIKTPYNKQKLIEDLGAFLRKEENRKKLITLLSDTDVRIISAVHFIPSSTREKLAAFFSGIFSFAALHDRLLNLEERLILYCVSDKDTGKTVIKINPLLKDILLPLLRLQILLPEAVPAQVEPPAQPKTDSPADFRQSSKQQRDIAPPARIKLTPLLLASFLSFIAANGDVCKADGSFKKRTKETLDRIFPGRAEILKYLIRSCINLSLISEGKKGFSVDFTRCQAFAELSEIEQTVCLCVAASGIFGRGDFKKQAQLLFDIFSSLPEAGFTRGVLVRSGVFILMSAEEDDKGSSKGRFSKMLENGGIQGIGDGERSENEGLPEYLSSFWIERLVDAALAFGLFYVRGKTSAGEDIIAAGLKSEIISGNKENEPSDRLLIGSDFSVTVMNGLTLARLLPLIKFLDIQKFDSVAVFSINRRSVLRALDNGLSANDIISEIKKNTAYDIPQNLRFSIEDWNAVFSSAVLYGGYVLKVNGDNKILNEKNPILKPHIKETLAPGVFLLDAKNADEAQALMDKCGVDFIGRIREAGQSSLTAVFPTFSAGVNIFEKEGEKDIKNEARFKCGTEEERASFFIKMRSELNALSLENEQREGLEERIRRKIILNPSQLRANSVRIEKKEARGMDFTGKIRIVERAMSARCMLEIGVNKENVQGIHDAVPPRILGIPLLLEKQSNDAFVRLKLEPDGNEAVFSVGQAEFIKLIRGSIFMGEI
ncbi:hypothetical protein HRI96_00840 [Treponema parvum]|uniref:Helicase XPB/Ssl2 N-terminal domain-containing protein n=1 Tax=Treponema parvum TaxID=138851 RepID=A0A975EXJ1_9SPIR|nr:hypothetical protein [Treponema parvum]QTQ10864.1 hypothetical protein HRI96_00840 [Treponema parvum]